MQHCDLKCANILSTKSGNIKIGDFGVSLNLNAVQNKHDVSGTPNWMAPEIITLSGASTASDIWSLGCTIVEMITGKPPYSELISLTAMFKIVEDDMPPIPPRCSPELYNFLAICFAKDPVARPTAAELFDHPWLSKNWDRTKVIPSQVAVSLQLIKVPSGDPSARFHTLREANVAVQRFSCGLKHRICSNTGTITTALSLAARADTGTDRHTSTAAQTGLITKRA